MALPINIEDFDEYIRQCKPLQREAAYVSMRAQSYGFSSSHVQM